MEAFLEGMAFLQTPSKMVRWRAPPCLPAVLIQSTYAQLKELGTHRAFFYEVKTGYQDYKSRTLNLGGRAAWYAGRYWGVFADVRFLTVWNNFQFQVEKTALLEQITETETVRIKNTTFGATGKLGIFLQIARWEGKGFGKMLK